MGNDVDRLTGRWRGGPASPSGRTGSRDARARDHCGGRYGRGTRQRHWRAGQGTGRCCTDQRGLRCKFRRRSPPCSPCSTRAPAACRW
jgi:hypothetical protein